MCVLAGGYSLPMYLVFFFEVFFWLYSNNAIICSSPAYSIKKMSACTLILPSFATFSAGLWIARKVGLLAAIQSVI
jgi:hypothetical protein